MRSRWNCKVAVYDKTLEWKPLQTRTTTTVNLIDAVRRDRKQRSHTGATGTHHKYYNHRPTTIKPFLRAPKTLKIHDIFELADPTSTTKMYKTEVLKTCGLISLRGDKHHKNLLRYRVPERHTLQWIFFFNFTSLWGFSFMTNLLTSEHLRTSVEYQEFQDEWEDCITVTLSRNTQTTMWVVLKLAYFHSFFYFSFFINFYYWYRWRFGSVGNVVGRINEVNQRRARLVLGRVTVCRRVNHLGM